MAVPHSFLIISDQPVGLVLIPGPEIRTVFSFFLFFFLFFLFSFFFFFFGLCFPSQTRRDVPVGVSSFAAGIYVSLRLLGLP